VENLVIRKAELRDCAELASMCHCLWPDSEAQEHALEVAPILAGKVPGNLPLVFFVAEHSDGHIQGFIEVGLRSHADGCDPSRPVGFVEGWYVAPGYRHKKVGAQLLAKAEEWARNEGCREMASDTWLDNIDSQYVHTALGFELVDRCIHYKKRL
jgi:aminoglycoside 6'-N-acetyltransferase I